MKRTPSDAVSMIPPLLGKVVLAACAMSVCQIIASPAYVALSGNHVALIPWMCVAVMLAVVFCVVLGVVLLWLSETIAVRISPRFVPLMCAGIGGVGFGIWGSTVVPAVFNSLVQPLGLSALGGVNLAAVIVNCVVVGAVGFGVAQALYRRAVTRWIPLIAMMVIEILFTAAGAFYLTQMYAFLY